MVGDTGVGKSNLIAQYVNERPVHAEDNKATIGIEFHTKKLIKQDGKVIRAQIWDTAGQERYQSITGAYYRGAVGVCVIFDLTDWKSFKSVSKWLKDIKERCNENIVVILIGNKSDLAVERRAVKRESAATWAAEHQIPYVETSAIDGTNVEEAFELVINEVYRVLKKNGEIEQSLNTSNPTGVYKA